jgi:hypothetical protein
MADDRQLDLMKHLREQCAKLKEQLRACESGKFKLYRVDDEGVRVDFMPAYIALIRRIIVDYDALIEHFKGSPDGPRP